MEAYKVWKPAGTPKAIVQIEHGMAEYIDRYDRPAQALNAAGYLVIGRNHRATGPRLNGWATLLMKTAGRS